MNSNPSLTIWRRALLASAALLMAAPVGAIADDETETVVVTGTRIPRPEFDLPNPTMTVGSEQIEHSGTVDLGDYLKRIPALVGKFPDQRLCHSRLQRWLVLGRLEPP